MAQLKSLLFLLLKRLQKEYKETACYLFCNRFFSTMKYESGTMTELEKWINGGNM